MKGTTIFTFLCYFGILAAVPITNNKRDTDVLDFLLKTISKITGNDDSNLPANATENGLAKGCKPFTMIFAKGTGEGGNVGDGHSPGPALISEMRKSLGAENLAVQGIDFFAGGDTKGSKRYLNVANDVAKKCPDTKIIIGGYSQGAQLTHNAAKKFSPATMSKVVAAAVFGDPDHLQPIGNINKASIFSVCHSGDIICHSPGFNIKAHLTYSVDTPQAASFIMSRLK
ncbi:Cutinase [Golovinomyces cichoracearum]|uniref:Cutinase n=1 Tax=Golovinomyces cichoracearum TaxID=62708 RepID=A0A420IQS7_9PEZI|nr:Cutinase [Golovinomyces cichoracearum]